METDKFEKHIKTKLNEREIAPSAEAWNKISKDLAVSTPSKKPNYFWIGIAASVLVLLGTSLFYFNAVSGEERNPIEVVESPAEKVLKEADVEGVITVENEERISIALETTIDEEKDNTVSIAGTVISSEEDKQPIGNTDVIFETPRKKLRDSAKTILVAENILNSKIAEVVAKVDALELSDAVTDAEVDSLLLQAQQDILKENLFNTDNSVNAMALLTEVEDELDQSFRDQIFESLKTGFLKVRTAVADRNN